jgi:hypothetical protein
MQSEHKLALTKNYVLLVNETPVDDILDELRQQQIVNEEQREFIARQPTQKGRTRALLELLARRGPTAFPRLPNTFQTFANESRGNTFQLLLA